MLYPFILAPQTEHASAKGNMTTALLAIPALMSKSGNLMPLSSEEGKPHLLRECLEPSASINQAYIFSTVEAVDRFYEKNKTSPVDWTQVIDYARKLFREVGDADLDAFTPEGVAVLEKGCCVLGEVPNTVKAIVGLYDNLIANKESPVLLSRAIGGTMAKRTPDISTQITSTSLHAGQMESSYGLSPSQRESLLEILADMRKDPNAINAINGPPGTGKTTLLQSIVASLWVDGAIKEGEPPLIVAASTNNQAVTNIIDSFGKITVPDDVAQEVGFLSHRWIPGITSYGLYMPSSSKVQKAKEAGFQLFVHSFDDHFCAHLETPEGFEVAHEFYMEHARKTFPDKDFTTVSGAVQALHQQLIEYAQKISEWGQVFECATKVLSDDWGIEDDILRSLEEASGIIQKHHQKARQNKENCQSDVNAYEKLLDDWQHYIGEESLVLGLLSFLPPVRKKREARDQTFFRSARISASSRANFEENLQKMVEDKKAEAVRTEVLVTESERQVEMVAAATKDVKAMCDELGGPSDWDSIQGSIDMRYRHLAFLLAARYWEGRYLIDVETKIKTGGKFDNRAPEKLLRAYRRMAKLAPCFVSTFHSLPNHFQGYRGEPIPLLNEIDLLVVDEAGQVSPDVAMASFALAKQSLVVGDTLQLQPVWSLPPAIDRANATFQGLIKDESEWEPFVERGISASGGNLMTVAQHASPLVKYEELSAGMFLVDHRRCQPAIINYCNELSYHGVLKPRRKATETLFPHLGYAHIPGMDDSRGGSRANNIEAIAICSWLERKKDQIEAAYNKPIDECVGIVSPFAAQAELLRTKIKQAGLGEKMTVGTVHSLQGAERPIVLFSPTYGIEFGGIPFFASDERLLNVAASRAKDSFLVIGNMGLFGEGTSKCTSLLGKLLFSDPENELKDVINEMTLRGGFPASSKIIDTLEGHRQALRDSFSGAKTLLTIVSPFLSQNALDADDILLNCEQTVARGVDVCIVVDKNLGITTKNQFPEDKLEILKNFRRAGCRVRIAPGRNGVHSKLIVSDNLLILGSFNWLSASRDLHRHSNYEVSTVLTGEEGRGEGQRQLQQVERITVAWNM